MSKASREDRFIVKLRERSNIEIAKTLDERNVKSDIRTPFCREERKKKKRKKKISKCIPLISIISIYSFINELLFYLLSECASKSGGSVVEHHSSYWEQPFSQPYFDNTTKRETTTTVGQTAYLYCRVRNLGDRAVSWIRKRDLHILTVGILTYTNDQRFQSLHGDGSDEWTLKISSPQVRDSGTYECQVSTEPKISQAFNLSVVGKYIS
ncbi:hemicentin-1-like isoform X1 [Vespula maculifrons]|uniref:Hemicentin-1-like isoform X1 n=1 Tax=Vespula maculifrons TaxID=7453 RepID=A0ABD2D0T3_VESMC